MQNHSHEKVTLALLDVELPPLLAQVYSKCMRKSVRVRLDWAREAKDQVGCRVAPSCVMLAQGKGQSKATNQKTNTKQKPSAHKRGHLLAKCMENPCKTVESSCTWFTVLVQGKLMQVAQTSHGPHYATSPQELALPLSGTAP